MKSIPTRRPLKITRYPATSNRSLQAWNAADELVMKALDEQVLPADQTVAIYDDRFGYLSAHLHDLEPLTIVTYKSQQTALEQNLARNDLAVDKARWCSPIEPLPRRFALGIIKIPKSLDLFKLYLDHLTRHLEDDGRVICAFMTRYFSPQMLTIAEEFFEIVEQSLAWKKSRLLTLTKKKPLAQHEILNTIPLTFEDGAVQELKQYFGVFSSGHIDYATQFLLEHLGLKSSDHKILDLAAGNGVIARAIQRKKPDAELHLVDDSILAVESSRLNLDATNTHFHWDDTLDQFALQSFDLVVSNPPFHFGHETNIEVSVKLFQETGKVLKPGGRFVCVANRHLNYKTHLKRVFSAVETVATSDKYVIYTCTKLLS